MADLGRPKIALASRQELSALIDPLDTPPTRSPNHTTLHTIASYSLLSTIWKKQIRKRIRAPKYRDFYFDQDPVQFAAFEWGLQQFLELSSRDIIDGKYSPTPALIIRGAKQIGLSRPVAMLSLQDTLIYSTIVSRARQDLQAHLRPWTGAALEDRSKLDEAVETLSETKRTLAINRETENVDAPGIGLSLDSDYATEDIWGSWLFNQTALFKMCSEYQYVVESDISSFFTSIDLDVVSEELHSLTSLDVDAVRLCLRLVRGVLPHSRYATSPDMGLPQEPFNASRTIAHSVLVGVDRNFDEEGEQGRYTRFVDDFTIAVNTKDEGIKMLAKLQASLEPLGLTVNSSKTRIVSTKQLREELMADENSYLDDVVDKMIQSSSDGLRSYKLGSNDAEEIGVRFARLLEIGAEPDRPRYWDKVYLRYVGIYRDLGLAIPFENLTDFLTENPKHFGQILEYLRSFSMTETVVNGLFDLAERSMTTYGDAPLLCLESVLTSPNSGAPSECGLAVPRSQALLDRCMGTSTSMSFALDDRVAASCLVIIAKFGNAATLRDAIDRTQSARPGSALSLQRDALLLSVGDRTKFETQVLAGVAWPAALTISFLDALQNDDSKAVGALLGVLRPEVFLRPNRYFVHARPLLLLGALARSDNKSATNIAHRGLERLRRNPDRLRDRQAESLFEQFALQRT